MDRKVESQYIDYGFGFPVTLIDVPMIKVRGKWTPDIDYNALAKSLLQALSRLNGRLTGNQVRFVRHHFEMTLQQFAERLGVTHPAVMKWEKAGNRPTGMSWSAEKDIRLFITKGFTASAKDFLSLYQQLEEVVPANSRMVRLGDGF